MKNMYLKRISAILISGLISITMVLPSYAQGSGGFVIPATKIRIETKVEEVTKNSLDYETAIKKSLSNSITQKSAELQRETFQDKIDDNYYKYDDIFQIKNPSMISGALANLDVYNTNLTNARDLMLRQKTVDTESLKIKVAGLFNNIEQQNSSIEFMKVKIAQGEENLILNNRQFDLGMMTKNDLEQAEVANRTLKNNLELQEIKLKTYYDELEKTTGISNLKKDYEIVPIDMVYSEVKLGDDDLEIYKRDVENFDIGILSKKSTVENKSANFSNYAEMYNFQYLSWLAGRQPSAPDFDYKSTRDEKNVAELDLSQTILNSKLNVEKNYSVLQQLQQNIQIMRTEKDKLDIQLKSLEQKYNVGMVTKNTYKNVNLSKVELENKLNGLIVQQTQLRLLFESPYFAGMSM